jgi:hypothetical protein
MRTLEKIDITQPIEKGEFCMLFETQLPPFKQTWRVGRFNDKKDAPPHVIIYGPDDKEYHIYGDEARGLQTYSEYRDEYFMDKTKIKIYVLTSILDERKNWC